MYIRAKILKSSNKIKATWDAITTVTGRSTVVSESIKLKVNSVILNSDLEVANTFQNFFSEIPIAVTRSLPSSPSEAVLLRTLRLTLRAGIASRVFRAGRGDGATAGGAWTAGATGHRFSLTF